ncbi:hypothetical protein NQ314_020945 [Rhamnusium bicolor]|uniref:Uncharacterized protein n=1 Tax=Rhamnusium bicolor TaxID=1586634 RepID=A0AAV8WLL6_9CUCU|nr:hypothetical protein NQ314_020945 [Rhamnusium bicolor]
MWKLILTVTVITAYVSSQSVRPRSGDELVSTVLDTCTEMGCVKQNVLEYLDNLLNIQSDSRNTKNIDAAIFKRAARVLKTHEFRFKLPQMIFDETEIVYNPRSGLQISSPASEEEVEPPTPLYGVPGPSTSAPSSYEPGWEPNQGGPYQRVWTTSNNDPQTLAYSAYYPGTSISSSSTSRP